MSKLFLVETVSMFRMRYVIECDEESHALDDVVMRISSDSKKIQEFSQKHLDEVISSSHEITKEEYLNLFDKDNHYLIDWKDEEKFKFINKDV